MRGERLRGWRRLAMASWREPDNPQIFGAMDIDARPMLAFIERARAAGRPVTPTHLVGRASASTLRAVPDANVRIGGGRVMRRPGVDVFFVVAIDSGRGLSGVKIERADEKNVYEIATELAAKASALKNGDDPSFTRAKRMMDRVPWPLLPLALRLTSWLAGARGLDLPWLGVRATPFGSVMVTNVGMFGLPSAFGPLSPLYRVPVLMVVGEITQKAVVVDGQVVARPILPVSATIDHRFFDAWHMAELLRPFQAYLADPSAYEPAP